MLRHIARRSFASELKEATSKLKATPKAGFKMPKLKEGQEIVAFRPHGHTSLTESANFNFEMQRQNNEVFKNRSVIFMVLLSFIPFGIFVKNAEGNFRAAQIKNIAAKRRDRLDKEHNVDREALQNDYRALDVEYRITEQEEIKKYLELGKTPKQYYEDKARVTELEQPQAAEPVEVLRETLLRKERDGYEIKHVQGKNYSQLKVTSHSEDAPDPRIGGSSIIFDSRLDVQVLKTVAERPN
jgi:hypothetical protein